MSYSNVMDSIRDHKPHPNSSHCFEDLIFLLSPFPLLKQSPTKLALIRVLLTGYKSATDTPLTSPVSICTQTPRIMA